MSKNLILLAVLAAGALSAAQPELIAGTPLNDVPDDIADKMIADGQARLADAADEAPKPTPPTTPTGKLVKARVLVEGQHGKPNNVVRVPAAVAKGSPELDADPAAVAYAESLATVAQ